MVSNNKLKKIAITGGYYISLVIFICILMKLLFHLPVHDIFETYSVPISYSGDTFGSLIYAQNFISGGDLYTFINLGAPFGWTNTLAVFSWLNMLFLYTGSLLTNNAALIVNATYLLSYPVIGIITTFCLRQLKINPLLAFIGGVIFTFLPFHYRRNVWHIWLALYYIIPYVGLISIWFLKKEILCEINSENNNKIISLFKQITNKKVFFALIVCTIAAFGDLYIAYFTMICIMIAAIFCAIKYKKSAAFFQGILLNLVIVVGILIQIIPTLLDKGSIPPPSTAARPFSDTETYGLKIIQMLMPVQGHRVGFLDTIANKYFTQAPLVNENFTASLGILMSTGFLLSLFFAFFTHNNKKYELESDIGKINIIIALIASIGGFSVLISMFATSVIRCYNRLSIFIAFFSLVAFLLLIQKIYESFRLRMYSNNHKKTKNIIPKIVSIILGAIMILLSIFGVYDQVSYHAVVRFPDAEWNNDENFVKQIEATVPANSMIFVLPGIGPGLGTNINDRFFSYDIWKPVLHSSTLKWSPSYANDDQSDRWNHYIASLPVQDMINNLSIVGFNGIYIDSAAYKTDEFNKLQYDIESVIRNKPIISDNGRLYFYNLANYAYDLRGQNYGFKFGYAYPATENTPYIQYISGWSEKLDGRWSNGNTCDLLLMIPGIKNADFKVMMDVIIWEQLGGLSIQINCGDENLYKNKLEESGYINFTIPKSCISTSGLTSIKINMDTPVSPAKGDSGLLGICVKSIKINKN